MPQTAALRPTAVLRLTTSVRAWSVAVVVALAVQGLVSPVAGTAACGALVLLLLGRDAVTPCQLAPARALVGLALVPLIAILGLALPLDPAHQAVWAPVVGVPVLIGVSRAATRLGLQGHHLGLTLRKGRTQLLIAAAGVPLGLLAAVVLEPAPLPAPDGWPALVGAAMAVGVFVGATEELAFRGVLQPLLVRAIGPRGVVWTAALSASLYLGSRSPWLVAAAAAVAVGFGVIRERTGSIVGVAAAHGLLVAGALVVWPEVLP